MDAAEKQLPDYKDLDAGFFATTSWQRYYSLSRPFIGIVVYIVAIYFNMWYFSILIVFFIFVSVVTVTHDVVHGTIGLSKTQTDWALFFLGATLFESGHSYRISHLNHHKIFPHVDDPEGAPAEMSHLKAILIGPFFLFKLYCWSFKKVERWSNEFIWLVAEGIWFILGITIAIVTIPYTFAVAWYVIMALVGSWVYPFLTSHLPHFDYGEVPVLQTRSLRGKIIPAVFLELTYHLEHHLYPMVPSHNLKKLSNKIDPILKKNGAKIWKVL